jgi:hypothetical protein
LRRQNLDAAQRLALLERHLATVRKSDPAMLRLAYLYNETGQYDKSLAILTTRRFHVWEGAAALHQPFVDACLLRGLAKLAAGSRRGGTGGFQDGKTPIPTISRRAARATRGKGRESTTTRRRHIALWAIRNLPAPNSARRSRGASPTGEMNYYRLLAARELGRRPSRSGTKTSAELGH